MNAIEALAVARQLPVVRTCGECLHIGHEYDSDGNCACPSKWPDLVHPSDNGCEHFNAPTGLYWVPDYVEDKNGQIRLLHWKLLRPTNRNNCGFERLGKLRRIPDGWIATRNGQPIMVWKHSDEALKRCAEALVEPVGIVDATKGEP